MIRPMQRQDIKRVLEIEQSIFSAPWSEKSFMDAYCAESNIYLVAIKEETVIGYCGLWVSYETADLCNMAVDKTYRQQGAARDLLKEGLRLCKERSVESVLWKCGRVIFRQYVCMKRWDLQELESEKNTIKSLSRMLF